MIPSSFSPICALGLVATLAMPLAATAGQPSGPQPPHDIAVAYATCAATAERRPMGWQEARDCGMHYLRLKLSLLGISLETYQAMPVEQRARVQAAGYRAYLDWRSSAPTKLTNQTGAAAAAAGPH